MATLFCCNNVQPFRPARIEHELKFTSFLKWGSFPRSASPNGSTVENEGQNSVAGPRWPYALQLVRQVNYGPLESKRYFVPCQEPQLDAEKAFEEVLERDLIEANFSKVNSYKNFRCDGHNKFFELNLYAKDPVNKHHWRVNIARPADDIDLSTKGASSQRSVLAGTTDAASSAAVEKSAEKGEGDGVTSNSPTASTSAEPTIMSNTYSSSRVSVDNRDDVDDKDETYSYDGERKHSSYFGRGNYSDQESDKDYTACSKECGYCGNCDY